MTIVEKKGLSKHMKFYGKIDNISDYLSAANIYLHTSKSEAFGLTMLEAMASKIPVVSLDAKGNRDYIKHGINGFIIKEESPLVFVNVILQLQNNKDLYEKIINEGIQTAKDYDISIYVKNLLQIYKKSIS